MVRISATTADTVYTCYLHCLTRWFGIPEAIHSNTTWENVMTDAIRQAATAWLKNCSLRADKKPARYIKLSVQVVFI